MTIQPRSIRATLIVDIFTGLPYRSNEAIVRMEMEKLSVEDRAQKLFNERRAMIAAHAAKRRAAKLQRTPAWADHDKIREIYAEAAALTAQTGMPYVVDHDIPLQGERVSGLHVEGNLRAIAAEANNRKYNFFDVDAA